MQSVIGRKSYYTPINMIILGLATGVVLLTMLATLPGMFGVDLSAVRSGSTEPLLRAGSIVVIETADPAILQVDDVVTYRSGSGLLTGRIVGVEETSVGRLFTVESANGTKAPRTVFGFHVVSKVTYGMPRLGFLVAFSDSAAGRMALIVGPVLVLVLMWARSWDRRRARFSQGIGRSFAVSSAAESPAS